MIIVFVNFITPYNPFYKPIHAFNPQLSYLRKATRPLCSS